MATTPADGTYLDQQEQVWDRHDDRSSQADSWASKVDGALGSVELAMLELIAALDNVGISISTPALTYVAPTASAPSIGSLSELAMTDAEWDRVTGLAQANLALIGVGEELSASSEANWRGRAVPSVISTGATSEAQQRTLDRLSQVELTNVAERGKLKESLAVQRITQLIANFQAQWTTQISSEQARAAFGELELRRVIDGEKTRTDFQLKKAEISKDTAIRNKLDLLQIYAVVMGHLLSSASVSASSGLSMSVGIDGGDW